MGTQERGVTHYLAFAGVGIALTISGLYLVWLELLVYDFSRVPWLIAIGAVLTITGCVIAIYPLALDGQLRSIHRLRDYLRETERINADLDAKMRLQTQLISALRSLEQMFLDERERLNQNAQSMIDSLRDQFKRQDEQIQEARRDLERQRKQLETWEQVCEEYLDHLQSWIDLADDDKKQVIERLLKQFLRLTESVGFAAIIPEPGSPLIEELHECAGEEHSDGSIPPGNVCRCLRWGYRSGRDVLRKARVLIAAPVETPLPTDEDTDACSTTPRN